MIYISFFRKKTTRIYFAILTIAILLILLLLCFTNYYQSLENKFFSERSIFIIESDNDSYGLLKNIKELYDIERVLTLMPNKEYIETIGIKGGTISSLESTMVMPSSDGYQEKITWNLLEHPTINDKVIFIKDDTLESDNILIGVPKLHRNNISEEIINNTLGKKIGFYNKDKNYEFIVKNIYFSTFSEFKISSNLFDALLKENPQYTYRAKINSYNNSSKVKRELQETNQLKNQKIVIDSIYGEKEYESLKKMEDLLAILKIVTYILIVLFIVFVFIVNKNQINDLHSNLDLEYKIGYSKKQIKFNLFKRLFLLYLVSYVFALVILQFVFVMIHKLVKITLNIPNFKLLIIIVLLSNILTAIYVCKIKYLKGGD